MRGLDSAALVAWLSLRSPLAKKLWFGPSSDSLPQSKDQSNSQNHHRIVEKRPGWKIIKVIIAVNRD